MKPCPFKAVSKPPVIIVALIKFGSYFAAPAEQAPLPHELVPVSRSFIIRIEWAAGAKARRIFVGLRGAEAPLFHAGLADWCFRQA